MRTFIKILFLSLFSAMVIAGCGGGEETNGQAGKTPPKEAVELVYVEWSSEIASTHLVQAILQEKMGYEVKIVPVSAAAMWQSVATGDQDGMVCAWLESTHGHYLEDVQDDVVNLGPNLEGTQTGLVVPTYVTIDSITQINENAEKFDGNIIGIDPGAGIMSKTEQALEEYNMSDMKLVEGSGATMTAKLSSSINNEEWVVVTGWTPHWKFARWDLKYLEDPKNVYGGKEHIATIVRKGLEEDMPEVYAFLDNFYWTPDEMAELMAWNQEKGADFYANAVRWMNENPERVNEWIPE
ncbi:MAG: glycine betaine ABC transporter substrate-binding protein [Candidatus Sumerlaeota bacterium]